MIQTSPETLPVTLPETIPKTNQTTEIAQLTVDYQNKCQKYELNEECV